VKVLLDTSVLIAAFVEAHPNHLRALPWLRRVRNGRDVGIVAAHSIAEAYSVLTTLPHRPRITPSIAERVIGENLLSKLQISALSGRDYATVVGRLAKAGLSG
jgi:predicted nucleic acid-binding protein